MQVLIIRDDEDDIWRNRVTGNSICINYCCCQQEKESLYWSHDEHDILPAERFLHPLGHQVCRGQCTKKIFSITQTPSPT